MNIGEIIKNERKKKKLTQKELAEKINKSERMVQKYENGEVTPSIEVLNKIGATLGVFIFNFNDQTDHEEPPNPQSYYLEQYLRALGYEIIYDMEEGSITLKSNSGEYELTENDINDLKASSKSFIEYKLYEIMNHSRKIGK